jgi:hypothetical protein
MPTLRVNSGTANKKTAEGDLCFDLDLIMPRWQRRCVADTVQLGAGEARDIIGARIAYFEGSRSRPRMPEVRPDSVSRAL